MLGAAAGPSGVVALTIMGLTKFDDAVRESARKLQQAWNSLEQTATLIRYERIYEKEGKDITFEEREQADRDWDMWQSKVEETEENILRMEADMFKARAEGRKYDPGTEYKTAKEDL